jgi:hypothetical protein
MEAKMSLLVEVDEAMLEPIIANYLRDALNRIEGYRDDCFDSPEEKLELKRAMVVLHNWIAPPSQWV